MGNIQHSRFFLYNRLCQVLNLDPKPILIAEVVFSNIGGTATGTYTDRQTETDRQRQTDRDRQTETDRQTDRQMM